MSPSMGGPVLAQPRLALVNSPTFHRQDSRTGQGVGQRSVGATVLVPYASVLVTVNPTLPAVTTTAPRLSLTLL